MSLQTAQTHHCPRCGYDLRGVVESWRESCPVSGTCSECGLGVEWANVLRPDRIVPRWSFEHVRLPRAPIALPATAARSLLPGMFWTVLRIEAPIVALRLAFFAVAIMLTIHVTVASVAVYWYWETCQGVTFTGPPGKTVPTLVILWDRVAEIAIAPYVARSVFFGQTNAATPAWGLMVAIWGALVPLPYVVLVDTMGQAKVRSRHLWRGFVYFLPSAAIVLWVSMGMELLLAMYFSISRDSIGPTIFGITVGCGWNWLWWSHFTRNYLKLPKSEVVTRVMLLIAFLAAATIVLTISSDMRLMIGSVLIGNVR